MSGQLLMESNDDLKFFVEALGDEKGLAHQIVTATIQVYAPRDDAGELERWRVAIVIGFDDDTSASFSFDYSAMVGEHRKFQREHMDAVDVTQTRRIR